MPNRGRKESSTCGDKSSQPLHEFRFPFSPENSHESAESNKVEAQIPLFEGEGQIAGHYPSM